MSFNESIVEDVALAWLGYLGCAVASEAAEAQIERGWTGAR